VSCLARLYRLRNAALRSNLTNAMANVAREENL
jgi:hypothetical protein